MDNKRTPEDICKEFSNKNIQLRISIKNNLLIFEGNKDALRFIGKLFQAQANFNQDCGFQLTARRKKDFIFGKKIKEGLYIHRLPCKKIGDSGLAPK